MTINGWLQIALYFALILVMREAVRALHGAGSSKASGPFFRRCFGRSSASSIASAASTRRTSSTG